MSPTKGPGQRPSEHATYLAKSPRGGCEGVAMLGGQQAHRTIELGMADEHATHRNE